MICMPDATITLQPLLDAKEWIVRRGATYCGEVVYYPASIRWYAHPWRVSGRLTGRLFDTLDEAVHFVTR